MPPPVRRYPMLMLASLLPVAGRPLPAQASVSVGSFPWETGLAKITQSLTGPVAFSVSIIAIVFFGACLAFSEGGILRWAIAIVFGGSVMAGAVAIATTFFGFTAGALWL